MWDALSAKEAMIYEQLCELTSPTDNFALLHRAITMHLSTPPDALAYPVIPFSGLVLSDVVDCWGEMAEYERQRIHNVDELSLISWCKLRRVARTVREFRHFQKVKHSPFVPLEDLQRHFQLQCVQVKEEFH